MENAILKILLCVFEPRFALSQSVDESAVACLVVGRRSVGSVGWLLVGWLVGWLVDRLVGFWLPPSDHQRFTCC